jgi:hypothetical protein
MATDLSEPASLSTAHGVLEDVSPLEQDLLDEYERLADNMKKVLSLSPRSCSPQPTTPAACSFLAGQFSFSSGG